MPKKYPQWLDNADAIDLRTLAERWKLAEKEYRAARDEQSKILSLKFKNDQKIWLAELEMMNCARKMTELLQKVPRYIKGGNMIIEDETID